LILVFIEIKLSLIESRIMRVVHAAFVDSFVIHFYFCFSELVQSKVSHLTPALSSECARRFHISHL